MIKTGPNGSYFEKRNIAGRHSLSKEKEMKIRVSRNRGVKSTDSQPSALPDVVTVNNSNHNSGAVNRRGNKRTKNSPGILPKNVHGKGNNSSSVRYDG